VEVPALRERGSDVHLIAQEMIQLFSAKLNKKSLDLTESDKSLLSAYDWPGNVRELQNLIERAVIVSQKGKINWSEILPSTSEGRHAKSNPGPEKILTSQELTALEKENILKALKQTAWKISGKNGAASLLNMVPTTLTSRIKALGITRPV
jgi:DNA-binding NtrC family response regulator